LSISLDASDVPFVMRDVLLACLISSKIFKKERKEKKKRPAVTFSLGKKVKSIFAHTVSCHFTKKRVSQLLIWLEFYFI
jgi:hypothetical protein